MATKPGVFPTAISPPIGGMGTLAATVWGCSTGRSAGGGSTTAEAGGAADGPELSAPWVTLYPTVPPSSTSTATAAPVTIPRCDRRGPAPAGRSWSGVLGGAPWGLLPYASGVPY